MTRKILITGAAGQLGKALKRKLRDKFDVIPSSKISNESGNKGNIINLDITERCDVEATINEINPNIIINCAAYTNVDKCETNKETAHLVNVGGVRNLIYSSDQDTLFIQISTDYVFDGNAGPYSEKDHTYPINYYGKTKLEAENLLRGSRRKYLIIRPNVLYSEELSFNGNFFAWVYKSLVDNKSISIVDDQISNPTYVSHLVEAIFQCVILNTEGIFHYGSNDYLSRYEFAMAIARNFKMDERLIIPISTEELIRKVPSYIAKRPQNSGVNTFKIEDQIGLTAYPTDYSLTILKKSLVSA